jgi:hypothetical protein
VQTEQPCAVGEDEEGVRLAAWSDADPAGADPVFVAVDVHEDLVVDDVHRLVGLGVAVQRCRLTPLQLVLEQQEGTARLLGWPSNGRTAQTRRTREALVAAAGHTPTVESAA